MNAPVPEDEDEQLRFAIALSLQNTEPQPEPTRPSCRMEPTVTTKGDARERSASPAVPTTLKPQHGATINSQQSFLGLDRSAMEQERLARLARSHAGNPAPASGSKRQLNESSPSACSPPGRGKRQRSSPEPKSNTPAQSSTASIQWPKGTVKQTWCFGFEREGSDIKIEEILQKDTLQLAVLSSFIWDVEWTLSKIRPGTKLIMVMHGKEEATRQEYTAEAKNIPNQRIRLCFPPMTGNVHCMHSKLMLLAHPDHLRIVIPTANLVPFDWGETGVMENTVFIIDLPRHHDGRIDSEENLTFFGQELVYFCRMQGLGEETLRSLGKFDFSATASMAFVHSIGGEHRAESDRVRTGYLGLGRSVNQLGLHTDNPLRIDFVASSIGALRDEFLQRLYLACQGDDGQTEYVSRTATKSKSAKKSGSSETDDRRIDSAAIRSAINLYFPSDETVKQSRGGPANAGTICFQERWYDDPLFHQPLLRDCQSVRNGCLMHSKLLFVQETDSLRPGAEKTTRQNAWVYVGSANCSDSAWGRLVKDRSSKEPKLTCRNWECGVLLPVSKPLDAHEIGKSRTGLDVFASEIPIPMKLPANALVAEGLRPWFF